MGDKNYCKADKNCSGDRRFNSSMATHWETAESTTPKIFPWVISSLISTKAQPKLLGKKTAICTVLSSSKTDW